MSASRYSVSAADLAAMRRQTAVLARHENHDEGGSQWQAAVTDWVNEHRKQAGDRPALAWWESKTETELHARARTLGLLG